MRAITDHEVAEYRDRDKKGAQAANGIRFRPGSSGVTLHEFNTVVHAQKG